MIFSWPWRFKPPLHCRIRPRLCRRLESATSSAAGSPTKKRLILVGVEDSVTLGDSSQTCRRLFGDSSPNCLRMCPNCRRHVGDMSPTRPRGWPSSRSAAIWSSERGQGHRRASRIEQNCRRLVGDMSATSRRMPRQVGDMSPTSRRLSHKS